MKTTITFKSVALTAAILVLSAYSRASDITRCNTVFEEVRAAVEKEPQKILMIVEDAMVASEPCACEIVKGAIIGAKADPDLTRQIVLAATHVSPRMAPVILECAGEFSPTGGNGLVEGVNREIGIPVGVQPTETEGASGGADYVLMPADIRGVYLIQPATGGISTSSLPTDSSSASTKVVVNHPHHSHSVAQSPSVALGP